MVENALERVADAEKTAGFRLILYQPSTSYALTLKGWISSCITMSHGCEHVEPEPELEPYYRLSHMLGGHLDASLSGCVTLTLPTNLLFPGRKQTKGNLGTQVAPITILKTNAWYSNARIIAVSFSRHGSDAGSGWMLAPRSAQALGVMDRDNRHPASHPVTSHDREEM